MSCCANPSECAFRPGGGRGRSGREHRARRRALPGRLRAPRGDSRPASLLPLLDGTERLGALGMTLYRWRHSDARMEASERYAHLVGTAGRDEIVVWACSRWSRRRKPMTIASSSSWGLAPPLVFATDDLTMAGMLEPAYDNGGDAFDYAVNERVLHLGVFDAMGHGLAAAGVAAFALSAYRHSRRGGSDLLDTYAAMHQAVGQQFPDSRFVTAVIAQLDLDDGRLSWISAGHPPPLLIRGGRRARTLEIRSVPPLGGRIPGRRPDCRRRGAGARRSPALLHRWADQRESTQRAPAEPLPRRCDESGTPSWINRVCNCVTTRPLYSSSGAAVLSTDCFRRPSPDVLALAEPLCECSAEALSTVRDPTRPRVGKFGRRR